MRTRNLFVIVLGLLFLSPMLYAANEYVVDHVVGEHIMEANPHTAAAIATHEPSPRAGMFYYSSETKTLMSYEAGWRTHLFSAALHTQGSVLFAGASGVISEDNANLFWNDSTNRLGIGVNSPAEALDVVGSVKISVNLTDGTKSLSVANAEAAYTHSQVGGGDSVHVGTTENTNWDAAYTHSGATSGNPHSVTKANVGLGNAEDIAVSTWVGSTNLTKAGEFTTGTWSATALIADKVPDHDNLNGAGSNSHAQLDSHVASTANPHSVTAAQASAIPTTEKGAASGVATLSAGSLVVENPANATATPGISKIPISDGSGYLDGWISGVFSGRIQGDKGGDVASADEITLGTDGNYFDITGTTTINHITKTGWQAGSHITLQFGDSVTVTDNAGSPAGTEASILLAAGEDFSATADDTLQLVYDGTTFREVGRTVI